MRIDIEHLNKTKKSAQSGAATVDSGAAITLKEVALLELEPADSVVAIS